MTARSPWAVVLVLALGAASVIGLARFAYALVLPAMRADLGWSYSQAGALGAANALGYLVGAVLTMRLVQQLGNRRLFVIGLALTSGALLASGMTRDYTAQLIWRSLAGVGAAGTFVCGGVLAGTVALAGVSGKARAGLGVTVFFAGGGLGILLSGVVLPFWLAARGDTAWQSAWTAMGLFTLVVTFAAVDAVRHVEEPSVISDPARWRARAYLPALGSYLLFGLGYIAYMTFIVAWIRQQGAAPAQVAITWAALGCASIIAPLLWGARFRSSRGGRSMAEALALVTIGTVLALFAHSTAALVASAALVGASVFMVPSAVTLLVRNELPRAAWGRAMAAFTILFAAGQVIGPLVTGWLADVTGSLYTGLAVSGVMLMAASAAAFAQRPARVPLAPSPDSRQVQKRVSLKQTER